MKGKLERAVTLLREGGYTCVFCSEDTCLTDRRRGVKPLLELYRAGTRLHGFAAADKVVGKAAAYLYVLLEVETVHAQTLSRPAREVLARYGIPVSCTVLTEAIRDRSGNGFCPMERAVWSVEDPAQALAAIEERLSQLEASDGKQK